MRKPNTHTLTHAHTLSNILPPPFAWASNRLECHSVALEVRKASNAVDQISNSRGSKTIRISGQGLVFYLVSESVDCE